MYPPFDSETHPLFGWRNRSQPGSMEALILEPPCTSSRYSVTIRVVIWNRRHGIYCGRLQRLTITPLSRRGLGIDPKRESDRETDRVSVETQKMSLADVWDIPSWVQTRTHGRRSRPLLTVVQSCDQGDGGMGAMGSKSMLGGGILPSPIQVRCHPFFVRVIAISMEVALSRVLV